MISSEQTRSATSLISLFPANPLLLVQAYNFGILKTAIFDLLRILKLQACFFCLPTILKRLSIYFIILYFCKLVNWISFCYGRKRKMMIFSILSFFILSYSGAPSKSDKIFICSQRKESPRYINRQNILRKQIKIYELFLKNFCGIA